MTEQHESRIRSHLTEAFESLGYTVDQIVKEVDHYVQLAKDLEAFDGTILFPERIGDVEAARRFGANI